MQNQEKSRKRGFFPYKWFFLNIWQCRPYIKHLTVGNYFCVVDVVCIWWLFRLGNMEFCWKLWLSPPKQLIFYFGPLWPQGAALGPSQLVARSSLVLSFLSLGVWRFRFLTLLRHSPERSSPQKQQGKFILFVN